MNEGDLQKQLEEIAEKLFHELAAVIEFTKASIQRIVGNKRILVGAFGFDKETLQSRLLRPVDTDPIIDEIVKKHRERIIPDTNLCQDWQKQPGTTDVNSWIGWPLVFHGQTVGLVTLDHEKAGAYESLSSAQMAQLDQVITRTANAIGEVCVLEEERQEFQALQVHDAGLKLIVSIGKEILQATDISAVLNEIVSDAMKLTHTDSGVIFLLNADGTEVIDKFHRPGFEHPAPRLDNPNGITRIVISTKGPVFLRDIEVDERVNPALKKAYRSMFAIPLVLEDFVMGVFYLNGKTPRDLTETEKSLLSALVEQAVLATQIKNSEAMYHAIPQFVLLKDTQSRFRAGNASFCRSLSKDGKELKEKDIIGKRDSDFYEPERVKEYVKKDQEVMTEKKTLPFEELHKSPSMDKPMWVQGVKSPVFDSTGHVIGVQAIFWDITEQKQMSERWQSLVKQSPDGIVVHQNERITLANSAALGLFGAASFDEIKDRSIFDFIDESCRIKAKERQEKLMSKQEVDQGLLLTIRPVSGKTVDVEVYSHFAPGEKEVQVVLHDLRRRKMLMDQLNAFWLRAAATIAHDIGNILPPALLHLNLLRQSAPLGGTDKKHAQDAYEAVSDTLEIAHSLLEYSRPSELKLNQEEAAFVYSQIEGYCRNNWPQVKFVDWSCSAACQLRVNIKALKKAIASLVKDSIVCHPTKQPQIRFTIQEDIPQSCLVVEYEDDGPGIDPAIKGKIFEPFFSTRGGTGVGLANVETIIKGHGGTVQEIGVKGAGLGGVHFRIAMPKYS